MNLRLLSLFASVALLTPAISRAADPAPASPSKAERAAIANEIKSELLYDPAKAEAAVKILSETKGDAATDTLQTATQAYALVDKRFTNALALLQQKKFAESADAFYHLINPAATNRFAGLCRYYRALAIAQQGNEADAEKGAEQFEEIIEKMTDQPTMAVLSLLESARIYDRLHRFIYTAEKYETFVKAAEKTGMATDAELKEARERLAQIETDVKDPLGAVSKKMTEAHGFLSKTDTGKPPQTKQEEAIALLDDLIRTIQEQQQQQQQQEKEKQQKEQQQQQQRRQQQQQANQPQNPQNPSNPAGVSALPGGGRVEPSGLSDIHSSDETDAWGRLKQVDRDRIMQELRERFPDSYQEMLKAYYKDLGGTRRP